MAISSWFVFLLQRFPLLRDLVVTNHAEATLVLAMASVAAGLFVEDVGSRIESQYFDKRIEKLPKYSAHSSEWNQYLRLTFKIEPVGQRYLRSVMLRFKFELGTAVALLSSGIGLLFTSLTLCKALTWFGVCGSIAIYLIFVEARGSHELLSEIRHEILKGAICYPSDLQTSS